ncbi:MAG: hypothetical protein Q4D16_06950 [Eubacteriales bacterium]|nr:hypothetical protein [Eubacteriales bacterium]
MKKKFYKKIAALLLCAAMAGGSQTITWAAEDFTQAPEETLFSDGAEFEEALEFPAESFSAEEEEYLPLIQTKRIPYGKAGEAYSFQLLAESSGEITWSMGQGSTVPKGLVLSESGMLTGTPMESGDFILYVQASVGESRSVRKIELHIAENIDLIPDYDVGLSDFFTGDFGEIYGVSGGREGALFYNKGKKPVHFKDLPECQYFRLSWRDQSGGILEASSSIWLEITVEDGLPQGSYEENITLETQEGFTFPLQLKVTILPASSKEYDLSCSPDKVEFNKAFFDENSDSGCEVLVTNIGTKETKVNVNENNMENYYVKRNIADDEEESRILKPGQSEYFYVVPRHYYGTYDKEVFYFQTDDGSKFPVEVSMHYEKPKAPLEITPYVVNFGDIYVNAKDVPEAQKVTIRNVTDEKMRIELDPGESFRVGKISKEILNPGDEAEFTVRPEKGLPVGNYMTATRIWMKYENGKEDSFLLDTRVNVGGRLFAGALPLDPIKNLPNGTEKTEKALGLPEELKVYGENKKTTFMVPVNWYLEESSYDPENKEAQTFQVRGTLVIKSGENGDHLDTSVTMEIQVNGYQAMGRPVFKKAETVTNYVNAVLAGKAEGAEGYQFVVVESAEDLEKENFISVKKTDKLSATLKYISKGKYMLYCRGYRNKGGSEEYGDWSEGKEINVKYVTPQAPDITGYAVNNCDIMINVSTPEKVDGFDLVLANDYQGTEPVDYKVVKTGYSGTSKKIIVSGVTKGSYYVGIHSYRKTGGVKVLSRWSKLISVTIKKSPVKTAPVIKKATISRRNFTVQSAVPKGANGYDWVLAKKYAKNKNGTYTPSNYSYIQKNKSTANIVFKNIKPGTYYLTGHAYVKGFQKNFGNWTKPRKIVIK